MTFIWICTAISVGCVQEHRILLTLLRFEMNSFWSYTNVHFHRPSYRQFQYLCYCFRASKSTKKMPNYQFERCKIMCSPFVRLQHTQTPQYHWMRLRLDIHSTHDPTHNTILLIIISIFVYYFWQWPNPSAPENNSIAHRPKDRPHSHAHNASARQFRRRRNGSGALLRPLPLRSVQLVNKNNGVDFGWHSDDCVQ